MYSTTYPSNGYACSLTALGGDSTSGPPSPTAAQILQPDIVSGFKSGYIITISNCSKVNVNGTDRITGYTVTAIPQTVGKTGDSGFCGDDSGPIKADPTGGTNCTQLVQ
jgi:type IV pilus assembly protein PilA